MINIKTQFISRYKEEGCIIEADFSQLEIVILAHLCKDPQLIEDIVSGIDLHTVRAAELFRVPEHKVTKGQRKLAKAFSFQLQYGSGAKNMADTNGTPLHMAQEFIHNYYKRYPVLLEWQRKNIENVKLSSKVLPSKTPKGYPLRQGELKTETGRCYRFFSQDIPDWLHRKTTTHMTEFKPTEIKNYPVQGTATGDIVPMVVGELCRKIYANNWERDVHLVNTVHDNTVLDTRLAIAYNVGVEVKKVMELAPLYYKQYFGVDIKLPLRVEVSSGPDWHNQKTLIVS